jgi:hypothetical protein
MKWWFLGAAVMTTTLAAGVIADRSWGSGLAAALWTATGLIATEGTK